MIVVMVLVGAGLGSGLALIIGGVWSSGSRPKRLSFTKRVDVATRQSALCALAGAAVVGLLTGWPVGAAIGAAIGWTLRSALRPGASKGVLGRLSDLATWIEALRDSVAAHRGLLAAIESTVPTAPASIKSNLASLVVRIKTGTSLDRALVTFTDELADASVDDAIAPLILAARFGGSDLQGLLSTAATNTRDQIALGQRTEVARSRPRRDLRIVVAVTVVFTVGVLVIGRGYFHPFGTPTGQVVLLCVAGLFAAGFLVMNRLARPEAMPRLFGTDRATTEHIGTDQTDADQFATEQIGGGQIGRDQMGRGQSRRVRPLSGHGETGG